MSGKKAPNMWLRMLCVFMALLVAGFGLSAGSLVYIMLVNGNRYADLATRQQLTTTSIEALRGSIVDCNGNVLATSATAWTVYITPQDIEGEEEARLIANGLAELLELDPEEVYRTTQKTTAYERIKRRVEEPVAAKVRAFIAEHNLGSIIGLEESSIRYYPNGSLASTVLGFMGDDSGLSGLEYQYEDELKGVPGKVVASKNARGSDMPFNYETLVETKQGNTLTLTLDSYVQYSVEKHLEEAIEVNHATNRGCAIVMNVNTGAVLGMATKPDFDPNDPFTVTDPYTLSLIEEKAGKPAESKEDSDDEEQTTSKSESSGSQSGGTAAQQSEYDRLLEEARDEQYRNKAISDVYDPGSVFKTVTGSAAIEEGVVNDESTFNCPGYIVIAGTRYQCHQTSGHGHQNLTNIFENSCNPAFIEIGQRLGVQKFYQYFQSFGLTEKTGIDLPGEGGSIYHTPDDMGPVELASESFGQTFQITPIQMITAVSAVCNGGNLVRPHLMKSITDADGNVVQSEKTEVVRQVISKETSAKMCKMLRSVVDNGSGKSAYVAGYRMGGKTGTSQKINQALSGESMQYIASFCGFAPADHPEYAVIVMIDEPHGSNIYGSAVSAPVAASIMKEVLPYLGVEAVYTDDEYAELATTVPAVEGKTVEEATAALSEAGLSGRVVGEGKSVVAQNPTAGTAAPTNGTVVLYTEQDYTPEQVTVPDLTNLSISAVTATAASAGVNVEISGVVSGSSGAISYRQEIAAGTKVDRGTLVRVSFRYTDSVE